MQPQSALQTEAHRTSFHALVGKYLERAGNNTMLLSEEEHAETIARIKNWDALAASVRGRTTRLSAFFSSLVPSSVLWTRSLLLVLAGCD